MNRGHEMNQTDRVSDADVSLIADRPLKVTEDIARRMARELLERREAERAGKPRYASGEVPQVGDVVSFRGDAIEIVREVSPPYIYCSPCPGDGRGIRHKGNICEETLYARRGGPGITKTQLRNLSSLWCFHGMTLEESAKQAGIEVREG
jgi:hypothetical protein